uniref:Uncharacterized protein n=1 Tax=Oryza punctata TaxID=4537 RepID=A0A0E0KP53_ORYPU
MYECTGRKAHGKFAMADGAIDSSEVQLSTNAHPSHTYTVEIRQELANFKRQRQEDCKSIRNALSEFNNQIMEYMMNGSASTPPPQINLVALFPSHSSPIHLQLPSRMVHRIAPEMCSIKQMEVTMETVANKMLGGMGNNSENVVLQRMDGSTFGYSSQQAAPTTNQGNSKRGRDGDFVDSEDDYADDGNYDDADGTPYPFFSLFGI